MIGEPLSPVLLGARILCTTKCIYVFARHRLTKHSFSAHKAEAVGARCTAAIMLTGLRREHHGAGQHSATSTHAVAGFRTGAPCTAALRYIEWLSVQCPDLTYRAPAASPCRQSCQAGHAYATSASNMHCATRAISARPPACPCTTFAESPCKQKQVHRMNTCMTACSSHMQMAAVQCTPTPRRTCRRSCSSDESRSQCSDTNCCAR